jgi:hypothetical protein
MAKQGSDWGTRGDPKVIVEINGMRFWAFLGLFGRFGSLVGRHGYASLEVEGFRDSGLG